MLDARTTRRTAARRLLRTAAWAGLAALTVAASAAPARAEDRVAPGAWCARPGCRGEAEAPGARLAGFAAATLATAALSRRRASRSEPPDA